MKMCNYLHQNYRRAQRGSSASFFSFNNFGSHCGNQLEDELVERWLRGFAQVCGLGGMIGWIDKLTIVPTRPIHQKGGDTQETPGSKRVFQETEADVNCFLGAPCRN